VLAPPISAATNVARKTSNPNATRSSHDRRLARTSNNRLAIATSPFDAFYHVFDENIMKLLTEASGAA
jgi:hypothetical protein